MKKLVLPLLIIILASGLVWYAKKTKEVIPVTDTKTFRNAGLGISFTYPNKLTVKSAADGINIHHDIAYKNTGGCDMMGDEEIFPRLTDLDINIRIINKNLVESMKEVSPYIPEENFVNGNVVESPGFIDKYSVGGFSGYSIYEGAEGCGHTAYYFPIEKNKTLLVTKASIQALSGIRSPEAEMEILAVPGVIPRQEYEEIFVSIMNSLEVK